MSEEPNMVRRLQASSGRLLEPLCSTHMTHFTLQSYTIHAPSHFGGLFKLPEISHRSLCLLMLPVPCIHIAARLISVSAIVANANVILPSGSVQSVKSLAMSDCENESRSSGEEAGFIFETQVQPRRGALRK